MQTNVIAGVDKDYAAINTIKNGTRIDSYTPNVNNHAVIFYDLGKEDYMRNTLGIKHDLTWDITNVPFHETDELFRQKTHDIEKKHRIDDHEYILYVFDFSYKSSVIQTIRNVAKELGQ